jgi:Na+/H+ antiporter NhaC
MTLSRRLLQLDAMMESMMRGMFVMFGGLVVLVLAWGLSAVTQQLGAAEFLVGLIDDAVSPFWIPSIVFLLAAATSFATGTSWGTAGILLPLALPLVWSLGIEAELGPAALQHLVAGSAGAVLAGAVFGDHASPISDTTILSSIAARCDHVEHVNTQLVYAGVCLAISFAGLLVVAFTGAPWWLVYVLGTGAIVAVVYGFGRDPSPADFAPDAVAAHPPDPVSASRTAPH